MALFHLKLLIKREGKHIDQLFDQEIIKTIEGEKINRLEIKNSSRDWKEQGKAKQLNKKQSVKQTGIFKDEFRGKEQSQDSFSVNFQFSRKRWEDR